MINTLVCDRHAMVRESIAWILGHSKEISVAGLTGDAGEARRILQSKPVDVAVVDANLNDEKGTALAAWIRGNLPDTKVLLLTPFENDALLLEAERVGVACVLPKSSPTEDLIRKIHGVAQGEKFIAPDDVRAAKTRLANSGVLALATLGETDRSILCHISNGLTDKEISQQVYLSPQTVRNRVSRLLSILGKSNRTQLALMVSNARLAGTMDLA